MFDQLMSMRDEHRFVVRARHLSFAVGDAHKHTHNTARRTTVGVVGRSAIVFAVLEPLPDAFENAVLAQSQRTALRAAFVQRAPLLVALARDALVARVADASLGLACLASWLVGALLPPG